MGDFYSFEGKLGKFLTVLPHSGSEIPYEIQDNLNVNSFNYQGYDLHSNELFDFLLEKGHLIRGRFHRELIDLNRRRDDLNEIGGVLPQRGFHDNSFLNEPYSLEERENLLIKYWDSFYAEVRKGVDLQKERYGKSFIIAGHTMEGIGPKNAFDFGKKRPDICIGTLEGFLLDKNYLNFFLNEIFHFGKGLDVKVDNPFKGKGYLTSRFGNPLRGENILQVEVNIDSYRDVDKREKISDALKSSFDKLEEFIF